MNLPEKFVLRLPSGMRETIRRRAGANRRSMNSEMLVLLERGLAVPASESTESLAALLPRTTLSETLP